ncbi:MAG: hypothetical protein U9O94_01395 [Nanoarchaeota archaeon]|nr:hypothetical protein [Nanoarchaeota archaeon]
MATILRKEFHLTGASTLVISAKNGYKHFVVGLSVTANGTDSTKIGSVSLVEVTPGVTDIYGDYTDYGAFLKGRGNVFNLPISVDNPYYEIAEGTNLFLGYTSSLNPFSGILLYYEESTAAPSGALNLALMGVGQ